MLVTAAFLAYTIKTWEQMVRGNDHADKVYEESKGETEKSLELTRKGQEDTRRSVVIAEKQLQALSRVVRAWITLSVIPEWDHNRGKPSKLLVEFANTGFSSAFNFCPHGECVKAKDVTFLDSPKAQEMWTATTGHDAAHSALPVGSGKSMKIEIKTPLLTEDERVAIVKGELFIYIYGRVDYTDVFGEPRYTTYAVCYEPDAHYWSAIGTKYNEQT